MATFIVRFINRTLDSFQGRVHHVTTGEEAAFSSPGELVAFMEEVKGVSDLRDGGTDAEEKERPGKKGRHGAPRP